MNDSDETLTVQNAIVEGQYANYRTRKSDKMLVLEIEIPAEKALDVFNTIGLPDPHGGTRVAVAVLSDEAAQ